MIRAALDARTGYLGLVVVEDLGEAAAPRAQIIFAGTLQLGHNEPVPGKTPGTRGDMRRVVTPDDVSLCAEKIASLTNECPRVAVVGDGRGVVEKLDVTTPVEVTPRRIKREQIVKHIVGWYEDGFTEAGGWRVGSFPGTCAAAHILLTDMGIVEAPAKGESVKKLREAVTPAEPANLETLLRESVGEPAPTPVLPSVMGVDPGKNIGIVIAQAAGTMFRQIFKTTIEIDVNDETDRFELAQGIARFVRQYNVTKVVIERVTNVHGGHAGGDERALGAVRSMATRLVGANWLGGMVEAACWFSPNGVSVETAPASHWRRKLCGGRSTPGDDVVEETVRKGFPAWPAKSTVHERDAAGLILWDAIPEPEAAPKKPRAPRTKGPKRVERPEGCTCPPKHRGAHQKACPFARKTGGAYACAVCGLPKRGHVCAGAPAEPSKGEKETTEQTFENLRPAIKKDGWIA